MAYTIGLDFGSNSVRSVIVDTADGKELSSSVWVYESGEEGILLDSSDHNLARQNPADYLKGIEITVNEAIKKAESDPHFSADKIVGIGVDTTGSTPMPVDAENCALNENPKFKDNLNAYAWLWKDHTAHKEAEKITQTARRDFPEYLAKCGGTYSSEWFFSKIWHCLNAAPEVYNAAESWVEICDWIPAVMCGITSPKDIVRSRCAAGHKAMFSSQWGGLPSNEFLEKLSPELAGLTDKLYSETLTNDKLAGRLSGKWAEKLGLKPGIAVGVGAFDAHYGAIGSGIRTGTMVKIMGTSTCDIIVWPSDKPLEDIPGICGIVDGSVLPNCYGIEAGQSAVGDILNWYVNYLKPEGDKCSHQDLTEKAAKLKPGETGLLALDWNNGNRTILVDQRLTGLIMGQTLQTRPEEIYRALIEATAFGALRIINRIEEYGVQIENLICCGGIAEKNPVFMQIYADVLGRELKVSSSSQTCALGAAMGAAVAAGEFADFDEAANAMTGVREQAYKPNPENGRVYQKLYGLYCQIHDQFGIGQGGDLGNVMKDLLEIKEKAANA
ncbi:Ribulokinase [Sedimentisphaera cyanobacteriorum]|uniref:Ribulokinase n=1 Tax=Sedimentisphaera cyanobacteriorum TaxID=1940790 RepID=A0A1Q2HMH5_9BACT|nr:ribulokinase [Sedimentisphaera cyanobacteriorum]AQQ08464.1 Ribulokinase [Sedimentisphaera cyanobacteriorum]